MQDLLVNDPADKLPLRSVHGYFKRKIAKCTVDDKLDRMFEKFRKGESHMAFAYANENEKNEENREALGIVTLEDVIEALFQSEIRDESDCKRENKKKSKILILSSSHHVKPFTSVKPLIEFKIEYFRMTRTFLTLKIL